MGIVNTVAKLKAYFNEWHSQTPHSIDSLTDKSSLIDDIYPVGAIYMTTDANFNPAAKFGGKWSKIQGRFLFGAKNDVPEWTSGETGGQNEVTLALEEMPSHNHGSMNLTGGFRSIAYKSNPHPYGIVSLSGDNANDRTITYKSGGFGAQTFHVNASHTHSTQGQGRAHNNMPPFLAVNIWERTE